MLLFPVSPYLSSFLLKLLDGSLVDAPTLVDEVACGSGLARVHVANHNDVNVEFFFSHGDWSWLGLGNGLSAEIGIRFKLYNVVVCKQKNYPCSNSVGAR